MKFWMTDLRKTNFTFILMNEPLSDKEIETFITNFKSYIERASVSELNYLRRESNRKYRQMYYTHQAKKHKVSLDYYISEFT